MSAFKRIKKRKKKGGDDMGGNCIIFLPFDLGNFSEWQIVVDLSRGRKGNILFSANKKNKTKRRGSGLGYVIPWRNEEKRKTFGFAFA